MLEGFDYRNSLLYANKEFARPQREPQRRKTERPEQASPSAETAYRKSAHITGLFRSPYRTLAHRNAPEVTHGRQPERSKAHKTGDIQSIAGAEQQAVKGAG